MDEHHHAHWAGLAAPELALAEAAAELAARGATGAAPSGLSPPRMDEAQAGRSALGFGDQSKSDDLDFEATRVREQQAAYAMRFATLRARLALAGWTLSSTDAGAFCLARWNMSRELRDLVAVEAFARQVGVPC